MRAETTQLGRSEGPWGRVAWAARTAVHHRAGAFDSDRRERAATECTKDGGKLTTRHVGAVQEGPSDKPALEPYWGKPAVRNLRGDDGNVGIIRSPVRAIVLPDSRHQGVELP